MSTATGTARDEKEKADEIYRAALHSANN